MSGQQGYGLGTFFVVIPAVAYAGLVSVGGYANSNLLASSPSWDAFNKGAITVGVVLPALVVGAYYATKAPAPRQEDYEPF